MRTDEQGRFLFAEVDPLGRYLPAIDFHGPRATYRLAEATPEPGVVVDLGDIVLDPLPTIAGTILNRLPYHQTRTESDGTFRLEGVPIGTVSLLVDKAHFVPLVRGPMPTGPDSRARTSGRSPCLGEGRRHRSRCGWRARSVSPAGSNFPRELPRMPAPRNGLQNAVLRPQPAPVVETSERD